MFTYSIHSRIPRRTYYTLVIIFNVSEQRLLNTGWNEQYGVASTYRQNVSTDNVPVQFQCTPVQKKKYNKEMKMRKMLTGI